MTGFGRFHGEGGDFMQTWEVRSVNGRFLDLKWKLPPQARGLETRLEKRVRRHASRGRVEISLTLQTGASGSARFDADQASVLLRALENFASSRGDEFRPDYGALLALPLLWATDADEENAERTRLLETGLEKALDDWDACRLGEGESLVHDLKGRFARLAEWIDLMEKRAPAIKEERFLQVRERLDSMLASLGGEPLDDSRFFQEMVILADRLDVSEELTRLRSHLVRLGELLGEEDAGRRLDFTLQECFREINTCGNKIQDTFVSRVVVDFKNELEKCREQVQNLE